jgi:hypothetical protein
MYSACLACVRPWVRSQHQKRKDKKKKTSPQGSSVSINPWDFSCSFVDDPGSLQYPSPKNVQNLGHEIDNLALQITDAPNSVKEGN